MKISPKNVVVLMLLLVLSVYSSIGQRNPTSDSADLQIKDQLSPHKTNSAVDANYIFSLLSSVATLVLCFSLCVGLARNTKASFCVLLIATTPLVHVMEHNYRVDYHPNDSGLFFTITEGSKELYTCSAAIWFLVLLELELKKRYGDTVEESLDTKVFKVTDPFHLLPAFVFVASPNKLLFMRCACYLPVPGVVVMYCLRCLLEYRQVFTETSNHIFQLAILLISSVGFVAVYAFADSVGSKLAEKIAFYKIFLVLLWVVGPGLDILHAIRSFIVGSTIVFFAAGQMYLYKGFQYDV